ncbi:MAG: hypothetical protein WAX77_07545 [Methylococcaceae bacterium]
MSSLKLLQEPTLKNSHSKTSKTRTVSNEDDLIDLFPTARYFQIHLRYIHDTNETMNTELQQLKEAVFKLDNKLDSILALLSNNDAVNRE